MRPRALALWSVVALATAGLGLMVASPDAPPAAGRAAVYTGCAESPDDVNPLTAQSPVARRLVLAYTHEPLLAVDPASGELRPAAAERFTPAADGGSCTFTLRAGLRFSDGSEATLDDVLLPWELAQAGHLPLGFVGDAMARVRAVERLGARTFRVDFRDRHFAAARIVGENWLVVSRRFFLQRLAARVAPAPLPPVDSPAFAALLAQATSECGPGTGPYRLDNPPDGPGDWRPRQDLLLRRNAHSWRRAADPTAWTFDGVRVLFRDQQAATNELFAGALDWYSSPALDELLRARPMLAADHRRLVYDYDALGVYRVVWNCRRGATADPRVRRALGRLFDVDALRAGNEGLGATAVAHAKPGSPAVPPGLSPLRFDPAQARAELRALGFDAGSGAPLRLVVLAPQGTDVLQRIGDLLADACRQAGVDLELRRRDFAAYVQERQRGEWDGLLALQSFRPWGDPWDLLHGEGVDNAGGWRHPDADRLADAARVEPEAARREALWRELHALAHHEQPAALLVHPLASILLHRRVEGATVGRNGLVLEHARIVDPGRK